MDEATKNRASVRLFVHEGRLEVEGSEAFVEAQLEKLGSVVTALLSVQPPAAKPRTPAAAGAPKAHSPTPAANAYANVFAVTDDKVQILKPIPGGNKAEKTVNAVMLHLLGSRSVGQDTILFEDLRDVCKSHGCLDTSNFSGTLKGAKEQLICGGSGKKQTAALTVPGRKKAEELATTLNAE